ncbi:MAG TPA: glycerol-3-phosphate dehydrogenase/oxidase, partial [Acidimicrobiales bacterium]|nr:glycerol-3-phosphate dehydrogenase/oxidase [Acidimicrobiales bacterium]
RNAPHLVRPLPFLIPLFGKDGAVAKGLAKAYSGALWTYDLTGGLRIGHRHRRIDAGEALSHFPVLSTDRLVASFLYWDAQADDARLTLALARTAARQGAVVANHTPVAALVEKAGRVCGARLEDGTQIRARVVVNAGGVWSDQIAALPGGDGSATTTPPPVSLRPAKGVHLAVPAEKLPCDYACVLAVPGDKRSIFVVPWAADTTSRVGPGRYTYVGTTDTDYAGPLDDPQCTADDVAYLLNAVNAWTTAELTPSDVTGTWAGLRPLISDARTARTADLSRRHRVISSGNGLVTVTGGKLTTYRRMAADTVDAVNEQLTGSTGPGSGRKAGHGSRRSRTRRLPLVGGDHGGQPPTSVLTRVNRLGLSQEVLTHLLRRYGSETGELVSLCEADTALTEGMVDGLPYLKAEAVYAARHEMAVTLSDVLARRTRTLMLDRAAAVRAAPEVAAIVGTELGWDADERDRQVACLKAEAQAELAAFGAPVSG